MGDCQPVVYIWGSVGRILALAMWYSNSYNITPLPGVVFKTYMNCQLIILFCVSFQQILLYSGTCLCVCVFQFLSHAGGGMYTDKTTTAAADGCSWLGFLLGDIHTFGKIHKYTQQSRWWYTSSRRLVYRCGSLSQHTFLFGTLSAQSLSPLLTHMQRLVSLNLSVQYTWPAGSQFVHVLCMYWQSLPCVLRQYPQQAVSQPVINYTARIKPRIQAGVAKLYSLTANTISLQVLVFYNSPT